MRRLYVAVDGQSGICDLRSAKGRCLSNQFLERIGQNQQNQEARSLFAVAFHDGREDRSAGERDHTMDLLIRECMRWAARLRPRDHALRVVLLTLCACVYVKQVTFSHTRYRALCPELIPVYRQSART